MIGGIGWHNVQIMVGLAIAGGGALAAWQPSFSEPNRWGIQHVCMAQESRDISSYSDGDSVQPAGLICDGLTGRWEQPSERQQRQGLLRRTMFSLD